MWWGKGTVFFFLCGKDYFRVIFVQNRLTEQKLCFFSDLYFFSGIRILSGFWELDQLIHFPGKLFKNRLGKKIQPSEKKNDFFRFERVSGGGYFEQYLSQMA